MLIKFDGISVDVSDQAAQFIEKERTAASEALKAANSETAKAQKALDVATAKADGLEKDLAETKKKLDAAPAAVRSEISARSKLETDARKVLGAEAKFDGKTDREVREAVAATFVGEDVKLAEKNDGYVEACFDQAVRKAAEKADVEQVLAVTKPVDPAINTPKKPTAEEVAAARFHNAGKAKK